MTKKLFYITSEMDPFASVSPLSDFSVKVTLGLQGIRDAQESRGLGDVYKRQAQLRVHFYQNQDYKFTS